MITLWLAHSHPLELSAHYIARYISNDPTTRKVKEKGKLPWSAIFPFEADPDILEAMLRTMVVNRRGWFSRLVMMVAMVAMVAMVGGGVLTMVGIWIFWIYNWTERFLLGKGKTRKREKTGRRRPYTKTERFFPWKGNREMKKLKNRNACWISPRPPC